MLQTLHAPQSALALNLGRASPLHDEKIIRRQRTVAELVDSKRSVNAPALGLSLNGFTRTTKDVAITILRQPPGCPVPMVDNLAPVEGVVTLAQTQGVTAVELEVEGTIRRHKFGGATHTSRIFFQTLRLWDRGPPKYAAEPPRELLFSFIMSPATGANIKSLPPSFEVSAGEDGQSSSSGGNGFSAGVRYSITVRVRGASQQTGPYMKVPAASDAAERGITIPFLYAARLPSPHRSLPSIAALISSPRDQPVTFSLRRAANPAAPPLEAEVRLGRPRVYCMRRPIPVSIRLRGVTQASQYSINLEILRKSSMRDGEDAGGWSDTMDVVGESLLSRVYGAGLDDDSVWAGEVKVRPNIMAGSFAAGDFKVEDFIVFDIFPSSSRPDLMLLDSQITVPVVLSTD